MMAKRLHFCKDFDIDIYVKTCIFMLFRHLFGIYLGIIIYFNLHIWVRIRRINSKNLTCVAF